MYLGHTRSPFQLITIWGALNMTKRNYRIEELLYAETETILDLIYKHYPKIAEILMTSEDHEEARMLLFDYLTSLELKHRMNTKEPLKKAQALWAINVLINILSKVNEELAGISNIEILWKVAKNKEELKHVSRDFILEFLHLFKAAHGDADIYPAKYTKDLGYFDFSKIKGRQAGIERSNYLDRLASRVQEYLDRYPTGLDPDVIERRKKHKKAIIEAFGGKEDDWEDYRWHYGHVIKTKHRLLQIKDVINISDEEMKAIEKALDYRIPFGITPYYASLMDPEFPWKYDYQIRRQVLPPKFYVDKLILHREDREYYFDFMGEHDTSPEDLITRRYPMIAIIKAADTCPQICVYCQRNWEIQEAMFKGAIPPKKVLDKAIDWFAEHPAIKDVLITGGDPFILKDSMIEYMLKRFSEMDHIMNIRFGTRTPITTPFRITDELAEILGSYIEPGKRNVTISTHAESSYEITPEVAQAVDKLRKQGIYVYNQQVYTFWVSRRFENVKFRMTLKKVGIDPYYNFYPKGKEETLHYQVPAARLMQERKEEARLLPGAFRTDEPVFNVPRMGKNHIMRTQDHELIAISKDGKRIYLWHPWEKNIVETKAYTYTELVSIGEYLRGLREFFNEDLEDYKTIWYYY